MKEKKYIDRLYQEKFRDFEAAPRDVVWKSIAAKLKEEEKPAVVVPLWSKLAGVAAVLAFLLLLGDWLLPKQPGAAVANEETEIPSSSASEFQNTRITAVPSEVESRTTTTKAEAGKESTLAAIPLQKENSGTRSTEVSAIELAAKNAIFERNSSITADGYTRSQSLVLAEKQELLEAAISEKETETAEKTSKGDFEISTHAAPIYYGNLGKGNFIDPRFNYNSSEGEQTFSYGVKIAYNINDKVKIRSGVNRVNMSYTTGGVAFQAIAGTSPVKNISLENSSMVTSPVTGYNGGRTPSANTNRTDAAFIRPGELNQKTGYYEVPLELEYNLLAAKFELNLIGGASTLFLAENEILLNAETVSLEGRANNLNNISFSTNIGLGVDYNLSDKFKLNLEPMLKYQINTFENASSDTRPYYFGIYSGVSYKF